MSNKQLIFFLAFILTLSQFSCGTDGPTKEAEEETTVAITVPPFSRDSAYNFVEKQVAFGPRVPNSTAHDSCRMFLVNTLQRFGAEVIEQKFQPTAYTGEVLNSTNIIGQFNPQATKRILLAAHYDSRHIADSPLSEERQNEPILGADDGASGVGVLLEIARLLHENPIPMGVDIIFFDAEDYGESRDAEDEEDQAVTQKTWALGAQHWARNLHAPGNRPQYGILLDMVGSKNARFPKEGYSMAYAKPIVDKVWNLAEKMGYGNYFDQTQYRGGITDDHLFVNEIARIPMIDIINIPLDDNDLSFGKHWHTHYDNMDVINARTLGAVGQVVTAVVYREAAGTF